MKNQKIMGAAIAAAAAFTFAAAPVSGALAAAGDTGVQCFGINACSGQGACKTANNACKGKNSCKGKGIVMEPSVGDCTKAGGTVSAS